MNIYVGNIPYAATEEDLETLFGEYGPVATATIIRDRYDGRSKGFGFVEMENQEDGERAIEALDGQDMMGRPLKVNPARPRQDRARKPRVDPNTKQSDASDSKTFHNPYTFVPSPPRQEAIEQCGFAGDFNPLECGLDHVSLKDNLWTGHIPIKITTVTPLVLLKDDGRERETIEDQTYDVHSRIPESSLRGMLRSAYEAVTNSRYACFGKEHKEKLAYRMDTREAPSLIPAIVKKGNKPGKLVTHLYTGTSIPTPMGPKRGGIDEQRAMYAAMLDQDLEYVHGGVPKTGDTVWAQITLYEHNNPFYLYWAADKVWSTQQQPNKPNTRDPNNPDVRIVKGHVFITNENIKRKHDERIFFYDNPNMTQIKKDITDDHIEAWEKLINNYRDAHTDDDIFDRPGAQNEPWKKIGDDPGETAWSPHLYQDSKHRDVWHEDPHGRDTEHDAIDLKDGDMVYASCEFDNGEISKITHLLPVSISRVLYDLSPRDLLHRSLRPAKRISELSPADRLFGWVAQPDGEDSDQESQTKVTDQERDSYKGRIRVVCENHPRPNIIEQFEDDQSLPLAILGQPKPEQARFYVARDDKGTPQEHNISKKKAGYSKGKGIRGRKQYWHHKGLEAHKKSQKRASDYWNPSVEDRTQEQRDGRYQEYRRPDQNGQPQKDTQNRSIKGWIQPGTKFEASLYLQNLQSEEVGALLWLLSRPEGYYFKLGYGKPLGFGSVQMEIDCQNECLPLCTGENWKEYYSAFDADTSPPAALHQKRQENCRQKFQKSMVAAYHEDSDNAIIDEFDNLSFIKEFLQVLKGPETGAPIHYPRTNRNQDPEGKNFEWFTQNERNRDSKLALPAATKDKGFPYEP